MGVEASQSKSEIHKIKLNNQITAPFVRVIGDNGEQLGVLPIVQALELARLKGVDLIEIAATANPPIRRLIDFAKYKYEQKKIKGADQKSSDAAPPSKPNEIDLSE